LRYKLSLFFVLLFVTMGFSSFVLDGDLSDWAGLNYISNSDTTNDQFLSTNHSIQASLSDSDIASNGFYVTNNTLYGFLVLMNDPDATGDASVYYEIFFDVTSGGDSSLGYLTNPDIQPDYKVTYWFDGNNQGDFSTNSNTGVWHYAGTWTKSKQVIPGGVDHGGYRILEFQVSLADIGKPNGNINIIALTKGYLSSQEILDVNNNTNESAISLNAVYEYHMTIDGDLAEWGPQIGEYYSYDDPANDQKDADSETNCDVPPGDILNNQIIYDANSQNLYLSYSVRATLGAYEEFAIYFSTKPDGDTSYDYLSSPLVYPNYCLRIIYDTGTYDFSDVTPPLPGFNIWTGSTWTNIANSLSTLSNLGITFAIQTTNLEISLPVSNLGNPANIDFVFNTGLDFGSARWGEDYNNDNTESAIHLVLEEGPQIQQIVTPTNNQIKISFDNAIADLYATNVNNYQIFPSLSVLNAFVTNQDVILTTEQMNPNQNYNLAASIIESVSGAVSYDLSYSFTSSFNISTNSTVLNHLQDNTIIYSNIIVYLPTGSLQEDAQVSINKLSDDSISISVNGNLNYEFSQSIIITFPLDGTMSSYSVTLKHDKVNSSLASQIINNYKSIVLNTKQAGIIVITKTAISQTMKELNSFYIEKAFDENPVVTSSHPLSLLMKTKSSLILNADIVTIDGIFVKSIIENKTFENNEEFQIQWNGESPSGLYLLRIKTIAKVNGENISDTFYQPIVVSR